MRRCVIIGGAEIARYDQVKGCLRAGDYAIYCDSGLRHREALDLAPDLIIGDFDSHPDPICRWRPSPCPVRKTTPTRSTP